jgi:hypothetical protein
MSDPSTALSTRLQCSIEVRFACRGDRDTACFPTTGWEGRVACFPQCPSIKSDIKVLSLHVGASRNLESGLIAGLSLVMMKKSRERETGNGVVVFQDRQTHGCNLSPTYATPPWSLYKYAKSTVPTEGKLCLVYRLEYS